MASAIDQIGEIRIFLDRTTTPIVCGGCRSTPIKRYLRRLLRCLTEIAADAFIKKKRSNLPLRVTRVCYPHDTHIMIQACVCPRIVLQFNSLVIQLRRHNLFCDTIRASAFTGSHKRNKHLAINHFNDENLL